MKWLRTKRFGPWKIGEPFFAALWHRPLVLLGASLALFWVVYVGISLRARLVASLIDTSRPVLASVDNETVLVQAVPGGQGRTVSSATGTATFWKNNLLYWDKTKRALVLVSPDQKPKALLLKPTLSQGQVFALTPAPHAVYLNLHDSGDKVVRVHLPNGVITVLRQTKWVRSDEQSETYAALTTKDEIVVHYAGGKTRTLSVPNLETNWSWDYDAARDAVAWLENDGLHYNSPSASWVKPRPAFTNYSDVVFSGTNGDLWLQVSGEIQIGIGGTPELRVISKTGDDQGRRWQGELLSLGGQCVEVTPEQEKLVRSQAKAMPHKP